MITPLALALAVAAVVGGCAAHGRHVPPASIVGPPDSSLMGTLSGDIEGRELVTTAGPVYGSATLTLAPDGHWTWSNG
ncbi:MAG: hypothetical protein AUH81_16900 [Candidatus Rokubacteria bacterium 13_1_40CM_4_69_5]|nr:MAG: hypothetical protein AUH81_16900 [Candidatus Rokubacteria bacterium 13_1_40CM_4_69_5]